MPPWQHYTSPRTAQSIAKGFSPQALRWQAARFHSEGTSSRVLTLLHKATIVVSRAFPVSEELQSWQRVLSSVQDDLGSKVNSNRKSRITVYNSISPSLSAALVTALLDDPLALKDEHREKLRDRWKRTIQSKLIMRSMDETTPGSMSEAEDIISIPSPFLSRLNAEVHELSGSIDAPSPNLLPSDILLYVTPASSPPINASKSRLPANTVTIVVGAGPSAEENDSPPPSLVKVDPFLAIDAINCLVQTPKSISAVDIFQHNYLASRVSTVENSIRRQLITPRFRDDDSLTLREGEIIKRNTAKAVLLAVCDATQEQVRLALEEIGLAKSAISSLRNRVEQTNTAFVEEVFGVASHKVEESLSASEKKMRSVIESFSWWKLPFKVDDLGNDLGLMLRTIWCNDLERHLAYQAGRLSQVQRALRESSRETLTQLPLRFQSHVLSNDLAQLSTDKHSLKPISLTDPITTRLNQLIEHPTNFLHVAAQRTVLFTGVFSLLSAGGSYAMWMSQQLSFENALGVGLLGTAIGLRWAVRNWEKAKKEWWRNWTRVGQGLERDLKEKLRRILEEDVVAVSMHTADVLESKVQRREEEVAQVKKQVADLSREVEQL